MRVGLAGDHEGFALKQSIAEQIWLGHDEIVDFGPDQFAADDDYANYVLPLARALSRGEIERGIAVCGSAVGAAIAACKVPGVRAAICHDHYSAHQGVEDDHMNLLCLGANVIGPELAHEIVATFLCAQSSLQDGQRSPAAKDLRSP